MSEGWAGSGGAALGLGVAALGILGLTPSLARIPEVPLLAAAVLLPLVAYALTGYRTRLRTNSTLAGALSGIVAGLTYVLFGKPVVNVAAGLLLGTASGALVGAVAARVFSLPRHRLETGRSCMTVDAYPAWSSAMAATYRMTFRRRLVNALITALLRLGVKMNTTYLLTVRGRRSGRDRTTPVTLVEDRGQRWLVAPYGPVGWVRNARANGLATLSRGGQSETVRLEEVTEPMEAGRVLKLYATRVPITQPFFDTPADAPAESFAAEARGHPVFHVVPATAEPATAATRPASTQMV